MSTIRITGAIDRHQPDPSSPCDPQSAWIGMLAASWVDSELRSQGAAIVKLTTGRGTGDALWGQHVLVLRWIGDPPPPDIAQTVYDVVRDGGPAQRVIKTAVESQPRTESQPSYRMARPS